MIAPDLLAILCCPETRQPLALADVALLDRINAHLAAPEPLLNRGGDRVLEPLSAALVRQDNALLYPIRDDIPILLVEEAIFL